MPMSVFFVGLGALQWGLSGGLASILMGYGWSPLVVSLWRILVGLVCMGLWLIWRGARGKRQEFNRSLLAWSALAGVGVAGNFFCYFISIRAGGVAVAITLMYTAPVMVYVISFLIGAEKPSWSSALVCVATLIGVTLMTGIYGNAPVQLTTLALISGLLSGAFYALFIFAFKSAGEHGSAPAALGVAFLTGLVVLLPLSDISEAVKVLSSAQFPLFIIFGVMGAGLSFFFYFWGLRGVLPSTAAVTSMIEPVTATLFGVFVLGQLLQPVEALGITIILAAVSWLNIHRQLTAQRWS